MARKAQYRVPAPAKPKKPAPLPPNFPQHEIGPPLGELQTLGRPADANEAVYDRVAEVVRAGDTTRLAGQLLTMALDETYYEYEYETDPRPYTRTHAVAVLTEIGDLDAVRPAIEPLLPLHGEEDDWLREEMPFFYAAVGEPAIEPLVAVLNDSEGDTYMRAGAGESLQEIAEKHPELRERVVGILEQALVQEEEDVELTGFLICNLLDVGAKESIPIIRQAFEDDKVDDSIVQMADVEEHFGLPVTTPRRDWRQEIMGLPFGKPVDQSQFEAEPKDAADDYAPSKPYVALAKVGRNDLCPCGSGKKYKKCHGAAV